MLSTNFTKSERLHPYQNLAERVVNHVHPDTRNDHRPAGDKPDRSQRYRAGRHTGRPAGPSSVAINKTGCGPGGCPGWDCTDGNAHPET
jgi:hypothetical protein